MNKFPRQGLGYDVHELVEGRDLVLGGVRIPYERGLLGHSDADVLTHAVMDALCGALNLGDIGKLFPDTDPAYKDIYSLDLLARIAQLMHDKGYMVGNVDTVLCAEQPKLAPYRQEIQKNFARVLACDEEQISIKATTTEKLGFVGREEGMAAMATVLLFPRPEEEAV